MKKEEEEGRGKSIERDGTRELKPKRFSCGDLRWESE